MIHFAEEGRHELSCTIASARPKLLDGRSDETHDRERQPRAARPYLLALAPAASQGRTQVTLPARKMVIAAHLAVTPETLSRTLRSLSDEHLIEVAGDEVTIPDIEVLRRHMH